MNEFLVSIGMGLCILVFLILYRVVFGPGVFNRMVALSAIGTKTLIILLIIGFLYNRVDMFVDISMVYALLNLIGTLAASKYLETVGEN
ncbi:MAG: pH regulation protein F [Deltaproteobacteria bacterium]|nr:pH regulation protein F [Deltaproteobacteria bacterium]MBW2564498.1 pH regulation protein F [Deltaproteobacteria bacterium]